MTGLQRWLRRLFPAVETESREWMIRCGRCGSERSVWDAGGVRYKASGRKRILARCRACGRLTLASMYRTPAA